MRHASAGWRGREGAEETERERQKDGNFDLAMRHNKRVFGCCVIRLLYQTVVSDCL